MYAYNNAINTDSKKRRSFVASLSAAGYGGNGKLNSHGKILVNYTWQALCAQRGAEMSKIRTTVSHPDGYQGLPWYEIRDGKIYTTVNHPKGYQGLPWYEIKGDKIYTTVSHPDGYQGLPWYEIKGNKIYTTVSHPKGYQGLPWYEIV